MTSLPQVADRLQTLLTTVAEEAAATSHCIRRHRTFSGASLVQTLVLGWLAQPHATLQALTQSAATLGTVVTPQALDRRFTPQLATCLEAVLSAAVQTVVTAAPTLATLLQRFPAVVVLDSTVIALPAPLAALWRGTGERTGGNQAALKLQVAWDLVQGTLHGPVLQAGRAQDRTSPFQHLPLPPGALRIADLGFFDLSVFRQYSIQGVFWLSRLRAGTVVSDTAGQRVDVGAHLAAQPSLHVETAVRLGRAQSLPARLLALRVPTAIAAERRRKLHAEARHKGQPVSQTRLVWADWTILVTTAPATLVSVAEAWTLYRARWQIELLFKLWKQHGRLATSRSTKPWRMLCEVYAKLVGLVLQHWLLLLGGWQRPDRSLVHAAQTIRAGVVLLVTALPDAAALAVALARITRRLAVGGRVQHRRAAPSAFQLWLDGREIA
jgi:hypothetical protein